MENFKKISKIFGKILIIIAFIALTVVSTNFHEPWSDEAQSFLIARDTSLTEMFGYMKYEGTPPLWVLIIKLFIFVGGTYETFYILPIIFSVLGVILFEFKIKAPWYIKLLFPFTYFVLYQYTIIARSYCLVFPSLMLLAIVYEKRFDKPFLYFLSLCILMNICVHTFMIATSFYIIYCIENIKEKNFKNIKISIVSILIFLALALAAISAIPPNDGVYMTNKGKNVLEVISEFTIGNDESVTIQIIITSIFLLIIGYIMRKKEVKDFLEITIIFLPLFALSMVVTCQKWHIGIFWILLVLYLIIKDSINKEVIAKILITGICLVQIIWTFKTYRYDVTEKYSASRDVAEFIKQYNYEELNIYGLGYSVTAIQPYFEKNIFDNKESDKAFNFWKMDGMYFPTENFEIDADMYVVSEIYVEEPIIKNAYKKIDKSLYEEYKFEGNLYIKDDIFESEGYIVLVKK